MLVWYFGFTIKLIVYFVQRIDSLLSTLSEDSLMSEILMSLFHTSPQHVRNEHRGDPGSRILYGAILNSVPRIPLFVPSMLGTCNRLGPRLPGGFAKIAFLRVRLRNPGPHLVGLVFIVLGYEG